MNIKLALLSLALVVAAPVTSLAQPTEPIPGKIGNVTISLTQTSDEWTEKRVKATDTVIQDVHQGKIVKAKFGNKEFITELLAEEILPSGPVADWSLKYVEIGNSKRFGGFFAVKKDGTVVHISENLRIRTKGNYAESGKETVTQTLSGQSVVSTNSKRSYKETSTVVVQLSAGNDSIDLHGVANESGTQDETYGELELSDSEKYTKRDSSFTGLSGGDEDEGPIFTGALSISALKDTADVSAFMSSFN